MNNPLGVSPSKGKQGTTRGKEKIFWPRTHDLRIRSTVTLPTELLEEYSTPRRGYFDPRNAA